MKTLELNKMGLASMSEFEMQEVDGGSIWDTIIDIAGAVVGAVVGFIAGGPWGAAYGAAAGYAITSTSFHHIR